VAAYVDDNATTDVKVDHIVGKNFSPFNFNWNHCSPQKMLITI
jgi:hypothetical protein